MVADNVLAVGCSAGIIVISFPALLVFPDCNALPCASYPRIALTACCTQCFITILLEIQFYYSFLELFHWANLQKNHNFYYFFNLFIIFLINN